MWTTKKNKIKRTGSRKGSKVVLVIGLVIFSLYAFSLLGSYLWTFINSLKTRMEYMEGVVDLPEKWLFSNYIRAFTVLSASGKNVFTMFFNSLWLSLLTPTISIFTSAMASYVMAKYKFPGRSLIWSIMIITMVIPVYGSTASTYKMYKLLNIFDSPLILVTAICGLGGSMMMIAAFESISTTYMEAAFLDGAGHARTFFAIILPQMSGILSALWIMAFIGEWNNCMKPIMYLPSYVTLTSGLYLYQLENERKLDTPILFAGALMCSVPAVVLFITFQDKFLNMSYGGGIKG